MGRCHALSVAEAGLVDRFEIVGLERKLLGHRKTWIAVTLARRADLDLEIDVAASDRSVHAAESPWDHEQRAKPM